MTATALNSDQLRTRLSRIRSRIEAAAQRCNRTAADVKLIAVTKTHSAEVVRHAINVGLIEFGENRVQEAESKIHTVGRSAARWHLIGHLQSNKARRAAQLFDVIHSLDSVSIARRLDRACTDDGRQELPVLIQVDLGHEATKTGVDESELPALIEAVNECAALQLIGLMTLPPYFQDAERARPYFVKLRELRDQFREQRAFADTEGELSMGMTHDFEIAIEEGATMVRIGTAIFGEREQQD